MATFTKRIDATIRDVGWDTFSELETSALTLGNPGAITRSISLRFTGVTIPKNSTINSAKITWTASDSRSSQALAMKIYGVAEDNTAEFVISPADTARTRSHTSGIDWDATISTSDGSTHDTASISSIVQTLVNRAGWASGNAMGFYVTDDGSAGGNYIDVYEYSGGSTKAALLTIDYTAPESPSPSLSPSRSPSASGSSSPSPSSSPSLSPSASPSPSSSISLSPSVSPSRSPSTSLSPSPSPMAPFRGLRIAKPGKSVLATDRPYDLIFDSSKGTLKYFHKQAINISLDANAGEIGCTGEYSHNLGYYPFCEVFVRVYIGSPAGNYEYVPFFGAGATILYSANYKITTSKIVVYGMIDGVSSSVWNFDFLVFVYKNNLQLS